MNSARHLHRCPAHDGVSAVSIARLRKGRVELCRASGAWPLRYCLTAAGSARYLARRCWTAVHMLSKGTQQGATVGWRLLRRSEFIPNLRHVQRQALSFVTRLFSYYLSICRLSMIGLVLPCQKQPLADGPSGPSSWPGRSRTCTYPYRIIVWLPKGLSVRNTLYVEQLCIAS